MKKLIQKVKCFFGLHSFDYKYDTSPHTEIYRCRHCFLFEERDNLLNHSRYYTMEH